MLTDLLFRLRALLRRGAVEHEIDEELRFHLDRQVEAYEHDGLPRAEAMRRARLDFGGLDQIKDDYRDALGVRLLDDVRRDLRLGVRALRATPIVTLVAIGSLALAIGANSAIFSIVNGLLLRQLPVKDPARLVFLSDANTVTPTGANRIRVWPYDVWTQISQRPQLFESAAAWSLTRFNRASGGETQFVDGMWATGSLFDTLGVTAALGRTFSAGDDRLGGGPDGPVAVISHRYWQQQYAGAADAVGRSIRLDNVSFTIVGVTPPDFSGGEVGRTFDVIAPLHTEPLVRGSDSALQPGANFLSVIARLKSRQSPDAAVAELRRVQPEVRDAVLGEWTSNLTKEFVERYLKSPFTLLPGATGFSNLRLQYQRPLLIVAGVVALVLLIACVNIANLLLARAVARRHELSVRVALGASRGRLARQLFTESLLLSVAGATLGVAIAGASSRFLVEQLSTPANLVFLDVSIDGRVLAFTIAVTVLTALLFGTAPAFRAARTAPIDALKDQGRATSEQASSGPTGWLVVAQVALSVVLVVAAGLFTRSFTTLTNRDLGFDQDQVLVVTLDPTRTTIEPAQRVALYERVRAAVLEVPDVLDAAISHRTPVGGGGFTPQIEVGSVITAVNSDDAFGNLISPGWFNTFGTRLVAGRDFTESDRKGSPRVAIVNEAFVRKMFGGRNPLGQTMAVYPRTPRALTPIEIVGVVADAVYSSPRDAVPATWYLPIAQFDVAGFPFAPARLSVRPRTGSPARLTKSVASAIGTVNPQLAVTYRPLADQVHASLTQERLMAQLAGFFGALALLLAGLGLYGVTAYAVSRRRAEIGIRLALGAAPSGVIGLVLGRVSLLVGAGIAVGAALSLWASRFAAGLIHGLQPRDPATLIGAALVLSSVATLAAWLPARRASRIDPIAVLRES